MTTNSGIHRLIEHHASTRGDAVALIGDSCSLSYRELNYRANGVARSLIEHGFRRNSVAVVRMERSPELAVVLLAVLKAGGAYMWFDRDAAVSWPAGVSLILDEGGGEQRCVTVDVSQLASAPAHPCPNLPILTRGQDAACVLPGEYGSPAVIVPHATITAIERTAIPRASRCTSEPAALDLWLALMAGTAAAFTTERVDIAAA